MNFPLRICSNLFASSVKSLIPRPLNSMLRRCCGLCSRGNWNINIISGGREENMFKTLENWILLPSVSTLLTPIVRSSKYIITSVVFDIRDQSLLLPCVAERVFWGIIGTLREDQSQLRAQMRSGSLYLFWSYFVGTVNNELRLANWDISGRN